jgi:hypothetical protein
MKLFFDFVFFWGEVSPLRRAKRHTLRVVARRGDTPLS